MVVITRNTANKLMKLLGRSDYFYPGDPAQDREGFTMDVNYFLSHMLNEISNLKEEVRALRDSRNN